MNAAAAHAASVMTVSAASMYWLLRHAQHARNIKIHKLHPLPEKNGLGPLCRFSAQWNTPLTQQKQTREETTSTGAVHTPPRPSYQCRDPHPEPDPHPDP